MYICMHLVCLGNRFISVSRMGVMFDTQSQTGLRYNEKPASEENLLWERRVEALIVLFPSKEV